MDASLRVASAADYVGLRELMFATIHGSNSPYTTAQRHAWMPNADVDEAWRTRLASQWIVLAEAGEQCLGFMSLAAEGYIDFAYIHPEAQGCGLFRRLLHEIETRAREQAQTRVWVHASLMAQPRFSACGFSICAEEDVAVRGEILHRFVMEKNLR